MICLTSFAALGLGAGCQRSGEPAPAAPAAAKSAPASAAPASAAPASAAPASAAKAAGDHAGHDQAGHDHAAHAGGGTAASKGPPPGASVRFIEPADGAQVKSRFKVVFGVEGMTVTKAGEALQDNTRGHHHVIIDGAAPAQGQVVPADATHIHYGGGQTEAFLELSPGKHTLTMQFADGAHLSYGPQLAQTITVEVVD